LGYNSDGGATADEEDVDEGTHLFGSGGKGREASEGEFGNKAKNSLNIPPGYNFFEIPFEPGRSVLSSHC
jgi:hypothetical protein